MITKTIFNDEIAEQVKKAADQNILVYDSKARCGEITTRLLSNLNSNMSSLYNDKVIKLIIDDRANINSWIIPIKVVFNYIKIEYQTKDFTEYYLNLDCMIQLDDKYLILAVGKNNSVLLGSC